MIKKTLLTLYLLIATCSLLFAKDFGLILDNGTEYIGFDDKTGQFENTLSLVPRYSDLINDNIEIYISAAFNYQFMNQFVNKRYASQPLEGQHSFIPELLRTEFSMSVNNWDLSIGRIFYSDPLGFIAYGLFDGSRFALDTDIGTFSIGVLYTGLLYSKRANIVMTDEDTYFAPKKLVCTLDWEDFLFETVRARIGVIGQFDLSGANLHTQYFSAKFSIPAGSFVFDAGLGAGLAHYDDDLQFALAGDIGAGWMLPTSFPSQLSFLGRISSGRFLDTPLGTFMPITTVPHGSILQAPISGLSMFSLDYTARFHEKISVNFTASYFIRSDLGTYQSYPVFFDFDEEDSGEADDEYMYGGYFLGGEFFARIIWSPISDVQFILGGGAFLPALGDARPHIGVLWRAELKVVFSIY